MKVTQPDTDAIQWPLVAAALVLGPGRFGSVTLVPARAVGSLRVFSLQCLSGPNQTARKAVHRTPAAARLQDRQRLLAGRETGSPIQEPFASRRKFQPRHDRWRHKPSPRIQDHFSARLRFRRTAAGDGGKRVRQFKTDFRSRLWADRGPPHRLAVEPAPVGLAHAVHSVCTISPPCTPAGATGNRIDAAPAGAIAPTAVTAGSGAHASVLE